MIELPSQAVLRDLLDYDPETGVFIWKERGDLWWDRRFSRREAFPCTYGGYKVGSLCGRRNVGAHRVAFKYVPGFDPPEEVDHINGDRADNRITNLRSVTTTENRRNAAMPRTNTSGTVGVCYVTERRKWKAYIHLDNRLKHLGYFAVKEDAVAARAAAAIAHDFHPNHGRAA